MNTTENTQISIDEVTLPPRPNLGMKLLLNLLLAGWTQGEIQELCDLSACIRARLLIKGKFNHHKVAQSFRPPDAKLVVEDEIKAALQEPKKEQKVEEIDMRAAKACVATNILCLISVAAVCLSTYCLLLWLVPERFQQLSLVQVPEVQPLFIGIAAIIGIIMLFAFSYLVPKPEKVRVIVA